MEGGVGGGCLTAGATMASPIADSGGAGAAAADGCIGEPIARAQNMEKSFLL